MYYFQFFILQRLVFDTSGLCLLSLSIQCKVTHIHTFAQPCFSKILSRSIVFFPKVKNQRSLILHCHDFVLHDISSFSFMYKSWTLTFQKYLEHYRVSFENLILFNFQDLANSILLLNLSLSSNWKIISQWRHEIKNEGETKETEYFTMSRRIHRTKKLSMWNNSHPPAESSIPTKIVPTPQRIILLCSFSSQSIMAS